MNEAISKAQYKLKAKIHYFLFSKLNLLILFIVYIATDELDSFFIAYIALTLLAYKFLFSATKMDNPYRIFLLEILNDFAKNLKHSRSIK